MNLLFFVGSANPCGNKDGNASEASPSKVNSFIGFVSAKGQLHLMNCSILSI